MVAIDDDFAFGDVGDCVDAIPIVVPAFSAVALELHADFDLGRKALLGFDAHQVRIVLAEAIFRFQRDGTAFADVLIFQFSLNLGKDAAVAAVQVADRLRRFLDQFTFGRVEAIRKRYDGVGENVHAAARVGNR